MTYRTIERAKVTSQSQAVADYHDPEAAESGSRFHNGWHQATSATSEPEMCTGGGLVCPHHPLRVREGVCVWPLQWKGVLSRVGSALCPARPGSALATCAPELEEECWKMCT